MGGLHFFTTKARRHQESFFDRAVYWMMKLCELKYFLGLCGGDYPFMVSLFVP
jgi:hypothetical protein